MGTPIHRSPFNKIKVFYRQYLNPYPHCRCPGDFGDYCHRPADPRTGYCGMCGPTVCFCSCNECAPTTTDEEPQDVVIKPRPKAKKKCAARSATIVKKKERLSFPVDEVYLSANADNRSRAFHLKDCSALRNAKSTYRAYPCKFCFGQTTSSSD